MSKKRDLCILLLRPVIQGHDEKIVVWSRCSTWKNETAAEAKKGERKNVWNRRRIGKRGGSTRRFQSNGKRYPGFEWRRPLLLRPLFSLVVDLLIDGESMWSVPVVISFELLQVFFST